MLEMLDLGKSIPREDYDKSFRPLRDSLDALQRQIVEAKIPVCIVFEGWDAAGKGDSIVRRAAH
jgi:AMP-polyphosphate phosphotransferase